MSDNRKILVVDDEPQIARVMRKSLTAHGYDIRVAADGEAALDLFNDWHPDLVVTDLSMPNMDGLELCKKLRSITETPIIVLSVKSEERTKVEALDVGADDYITKPFGMSELLARIRANLRRVPDKQSATETIITSGDFCVDIAAHKVTVCEKEIHLTPKEFELLTYMVKHAGKVLTHRTLLSAIWGGNFAEQTEYLRVFVGQLRKKIEPDLSSPKYIITEPWIGYRFNTEA